MSKDISELQGHTYFIRHKDEESGPFEMVVLREKWATGVVGNDTKFRRADLEYWVDAEDLRMELEFVPPPEEPEPPPIPPTLLAAPAQPRVAPRSVSPSAPKQKVIVKTYRGREQQATELFREDAEKMAAQGYVPISQAYAPGSYSAVAFIVAILLWFVCIGIIVFIYMLFVKPPGVLTVTYEHREEKQELATSASPPVMPRYFLLLNGAVIGPHDIALLRAMRSAGQINSETLCCLEGSESWSELGKALS